VKEPTQDFQLSALVLYYQHAIDANGSIIGTFAINWLVTTLASHTKNIFKITTHSTTK